MQPDSDTMALKPEYLDIIISDVRTKNGLAFSIQILNTEGTDHNVLRCCFATEYRPQA